MNPNICLGERDLIRHAAEMLSAIASMHSASTAGKWQMAVNRDVPGFGSVVAVNEAGEHRLIAQGIDIDCAFMAMAHNDILKVTDALWAFIQEVKNGNIQLTQEMEDALDKLISHA